ncbi:MAG TPA: hypothetical protein VFR93_00045 [Candidatus Limnocylindrales bacterium]|nr:hypothetical protein [Candidatus Limnocylindrales bacterium]
MGVPGQTRGAAFVLVVAGPLGGIALWYVFDRWLDAPGLALGLGAAVIYVATVVAAAVTADRPVPSALRDAALRLVAVAVPDILLLLVGVPALVALPIAVVLGPLLDPVLSRLVRLVARPDRPKLAPPAAGPTAAGNAHGDRNEVAS